MKVYQLEKSDSTFGGEVIRDIFREPVVPSQICLGELARVPEPFNGTAMTWL